MVRGVWLLAAGWLVSSCGGMPAYLESAYYRDLATLRRDIRAAVAAGDVKEREVVALAAAVARRELRSAQGAAAQARILSARACVGTVERELFERAEGEDDAAALATLVLLEAGRLSGDDLVEAHFESSSGAWRAVAARATKEARLAPLRRHYYLDPDERVRRSALLTAMEAADPLDLPLLLETARLDPLPENRSLAVRALGHIGEPGTVVLLSDLWARADDELRLGIVEAWGTPALLPAGGKERLLALAETRQGLAAVVAAASLAASGAAEARVGEAVLAHFVGEGTRDERFLAIRLVSLQSRALVSAVEAAAAPSGDPEVEVVAWARLVELPTSSARARKELGRIAQGKDGASRQAQAALAAAGDPAVIPSLVGALAGRPAADRRRAALGLFRLGQAAKMAPALADSDPEVRMGVACSVAGGRVQG